MSKTTKEIRIILRSIKIVKITAIYNHQMDDFKQSTSNSVNPVLNTIKPAQNATKHWSQASMSLSKQGIITGFYQLPIWSTCYTIQFLVRDVI